MAGDHPAFFCIFRMEKNKLTFTRGERLKSTKAIASLFQDGHTALVYPLKIVWKEFNHDSKTPIQAAFSVSSRNFKKSTDRNLLKRRMRESFRLCKNEFSDGLGDRRIIVMFIYIGKEETEYARINHSVIALLKKIIKKLYSS